MSKARRNRQLNNKTNSQSNQETQKQRFPTTQPTPTPAGIFTGTPAPAGYSTGLPQPAIKKAGGKEAQGSEVYAGTLTTGFQRFGMPRINTQLIAQYEQNAILADPVKNLKRLMFKDDPIFMVFDPNGEEDPDLSQFIKNIATDIDLFAKAQWAFHDRVFGGCAVFSFGWEQKPVTIGDATLTLNVPVECRHLPWNSFWQQAPGYFTVYNPIMPGIVVDRNMETHVYQAIDQFVDLGSVGGNPSGLYHLVEIMPKHPTGETCFKIIKDPAAQDPAGLPDCLPVIPLITMYDHANQADNQRMNRIGAPSIFIRIDELTADNKEYVQAFVSRWGKDTSFFLPNKGWEMLNPYITDTATAMERMVFIKGLIDSFFNPATPLGQATGGSSMGRSDAGATDMLNGFINNTLSWIEDGFEDIFNECLELNGYKEYYCEIMFPRQQQRNDDAIRAEMTVLAQYGAITPNEMREHSPNLDLPRVEDNPAFDLPVEKQQQPASPFGGFGASSPAGAPGTPVGNTAGWTPGELDQLVRAFYAKRAELDNVESPIVRTDAYSMTESELISAVRQCKKDVMKAVVGKIDNLAPGVPDVRLQGKDQRPDSAYDPEELAMGTKVEMEHTSDPETAKALAKTQLDENKKYYSEMRFKGML